MSMCKPVKANLSASSRGTKLRGDALATYDQRPHNTGKLSERSSKMRLVPGRRQSTSATNTAKATHN
eukprot:997102-Lingulodinium_polyedra.AAC.1